MERVETNVKLRSCTKCSKLFAGVEDGVCLKCLKNETYYRRTRKKGEPKTFIEYPELLEKWRTRRRECITWRKEAIKAGHEKYLRHQLEHEKSILLSVITATNVDLDAVEELGKQIEQLKIQNGVLEARARFAEQRTYTPYVQYRASDNITIPHDQWRRLVQLAHPDKHNNSKASTEVMQWLLQNKPG